MASPSVTYTFVNATVADATEVNTNFNNIISALTDGTKTLTFAAATVGGQVLATGATAGAPAFAAAIDTDTGIVFPVASQMAFSIGGTNAFTLTVSSLQSSTHVVQASVGAVGAPSFSFVSDPDTGMFRNSANELSFATAGSEWLRITSTGQVAAVSAGSVSAPVLTQTTDLNTGVYFPAADQLSLACGGVSIVDLNTTAVGLNRNQINFGTNASAASIALVAGSSFDNGAISLTGGTASLNSSYYRIYGRTHATLADKHVFFGTGGVEMGSMSGAGIWTLGEASGVQTFAINALAVQQTVSSASQALYRVQNTGVGDAILSVNVSGAGDPHIHFNGSGLATLWHAGVDNSASDIFCIGAGTAPGTTDYLTIDGSGLVSVGASGGTQLHVINGSTSTTVNSTIAGKLITTGAVVASAATINALASTTSYVKFSGSTATQINGITAGADGQMMCLTSLSANLTIANQNGSASGSARIYTNTGSDVVLTAPCSATLIYDGTAGSWFLVSNLA